MGLSIVYSALRDLPLSDEEERSITDICERFLLRSLAENLPRPSESFNGEDFGLYKNAEAIKEVFGGVTALPTNSEDDLWFVMQHWSDLLTEVRHAIPDASWSVYVDEHEILWDETKHRYDPTL